MLVAIKYGIRIGMTRIQAQIDKAIRETRYCEVGDRTR